MNDDPHDLSDLLSDAVADVEPADRLGRIRARTAVRRRRSRMRAGMAVLAAAAAVTVAAVVVGPLLDRETSTPPATDPSGTPSATVPVYYWCTTPTGERLCRYFERADGDDLDTALRLATQQPADPDYRPVFPEGTFLGGVVRDGVIEVSLDPDQVDTQTEPDPDPGSGALAVQQIVYTVQAVAGERLPVVFLVDGEPLARLRGVDTSQPVAQAPELETLALVNISDPAEGLVVEGGSFLARGVASSFEATVPWALRDESDAVVVTGFATAEGSGNRLYPWETRVDVVGLPPGRYTFVASTSDPSGGAEGPGATSDTRTVVVP